MTAGPDVRIGGARMTVELVYFTACPNWQAAERRLRALATELGFDLRRRAVASVEQAEAAGMRGSPTILIDGRDPFATDGDPPSLSCRLYATPAGPAGSPTLDQLRVVLGA